MAARKLDEEIDRLYQLPLEEFTAARNALAKSGGGAEVRTLAKPPVAAWAVNQLYWQKRDQYDELIAASEEARKTQKAVLAGRSGDLRSAGRAHDAAVDKALKATLAILDDAGQPATDATRQAIVTTLRALPSTEPPGRLTRALQPGGFEMLAGLSIAGGGRVPAAKPAATKGGKPSGTAARASKDRAEPGASAKKPTAAQAAASAKAVARAKEAVASATRDLRQAEHAAQREAFEAARAAREAEKAAKQVAQARAEFEAAREALEAAEADVPATERAREATARRAEKAEQAAEAARARLETAQAELDRL